MVEPREADKIKRQVLIVEDEYVNREILRNILEKTYEVASAENGRAALDMLYDPQYDFSLILLDLLMPEMNGHEFLKICKSREELKRIPIIVMTSEANEEVKSIHLGAADFIAKPYDMPEVILARCERIIELSEDRNIIQSTEHDSPTGLYTKDYFFEYINRLERFNRQHTEVIDAIAINIDHFHIINEIHGRSFGDEVLIKLADTIRLILKDLKGIACRSEADTFYIYCEHIDDYEEVMKMVNSEIETMDRSTHIRVRAGIYENVDRKISVEDWFDRARTACNRIRGDYTRQVAFYNIELHNRSIFQERLINDIHDAIAHNDLLVFYQPKYNIKGDNPKLASAEALVRWRHPEFGMINPGEFIPLFESNGLIQKLDNYVWKEAGLQIRKWREKYGITIPVSVNVSRIDIYDPDLETKLVRILDNNGLTPDEYMLEITESAYSDNSAHLIHVVESLRERGFCIEMDDFGTGYSSLNMLTSIPIDILKMDMKFIRDMNKNEKSLKLVELIMDIAKFLDVPVVAEGVEDEAQVNTLKKMGCEVIQGYFFSKPLPPEKFEYFIEEELKRRQND